MCEYGNEACSKKMLGVLRSANKALENHYITSLLFIGTKAKEIGGLHQESHWYKISAKSKNPHTVSPLENKGAADNTLLRRHFSR